MFNAKKKSIAIIMFLAFYFLMNSTMVASASYEDTSPIIYFYSPTCSSCTKEVGILNKYKKSHKDIKIIKYDITKGDNYTLFKRYCKAYSLDYDKSTVPAIFVGQKAFIGEKSLKDAIDKKALDHLKYEKNIEVISSDIKLEKERMSDKSISVLYSLAAGFLDGFNPCAMAMLLLFISVLGFSNNKSVLIKITIAYILGLFLSYFALGTILFKFLSDINLSFLHAALNYLVIALCVILALLNIYDYINIKKERYKNIVLQLPKGFQKFNKKIMNNGADLFKKYKSFGYIVIFFIGTVVAFSEFLCTGQVYLPVIISLIQINKMLSFTTVGYLLIYNIAFIIPLIIIAVISIKTKSIFTMSDKIRDKLHLIKLVNVIFFIIIGIIYAVVFI